MIKCIELDKEFATKQEMFKALLENSDKIIGLKKAAVQKSCEKGQLSTFDLLKTDNANKAPFEIEEGFIYPVINTTKFMDSHNDVHFDGIWNKSAKEQNGKTYYVANHKLEIGNVIAYPQDVTVMVKSVPWSFVGKNYEGETEALIYKIAKDKIKLQAAKDVIAEKHPVQNSIAMQYVDIKLAMNSDDVEFKENKDYFDSNINLIANKETAIERGYFWAVKEAKIVREGSMVLFGSNEATPIKYEAVNNTSNKEPEQSTQPEVKTIKINPNLL